MISLENNTILCQLQVEKQQKNIKLQYEFMNTCCNTIESSDCSIRVFQSLKYVAFYKYFQLLSTIIITNAGGKNGMWAGDRKKGINKCWPCKSIILVMLTFSIPSLCS